MEQARNIAIVEPVLDAAPEAEPEPNLGLRLAVPLLLAAGWGALITFSMGFLLEEARLDTAAAASDRHPLVEPASLDRLASRLTPDSASAGVLPETAGGAEATARGVPKLQTVALTAPEAAIGTAEGQRPTLQRAEFVGTWGPKASACSSKSRRRGYLPATITEDSARAGKTLCRFRDGRRVGAAWTMAAECSERGRKWTSQVRLLVDGDRLTWASAKGRASYVRCDR